MGVSPRRQLIAAVGDREQWWVSPGGCEARHRHQDDVGVLFQEEADEPWYVFAKGCEGTYFGTPEAAIEVATKIVESRPEPHLEGHAVG